MTPNEKWNVLQCTLARSRQEKSGRVLGGSLRRLLMARLPALARSERLVMRPWTVDDEPAMSAAITASVDHLLPWMPWAAFEPASAAARIAHIVRWDEEWEAGGDVVFGIFALDGTVLGGTGLHRRLGPDGLEIGYWVHVDHVGRGYAREASRALTDLAFTIDGIDRVEIHHDRANLASARVPDALGYTLVSEIEREITAPGECGMTCVWRVTRADWLSRTS